jgi:hypothetical protein
MPNETDFEEDEYLYRGILEVFWDFENDRPTSAIFKDSKGVSVDRSFDRNEDDCVTFLKKNKKFYRICNIQVKEVKSVDVIVIYKKIPENIYHSEIHDSSEKIQIKGSKAKKLRDKINKIFE